MESSEDGGTNTHTSTIQIPVGIDPRSLYRTYFRSLDHTVKLLSAGQCKWYRVYELVQYAQYMTPVTHNSLIQKMNDEKKNWQLVNILNFISGR